MTKNFGDAVRDENLRGGRAAAEAMINAELERVRHNANAIVDAFSVRALFCRHVWNEPEVAMGAYLAAAGAMLALREGVPGVESGNLLIGAAEAAHNAGDAETSRAIAMLALRLGTLARRDDVEDGARELLKRLE